MSNGIILIFLRIRKIKNPYKTKGSIIGKRPDKTNEIVKNFFNLLCKIFFLSVDLILKPAFNKARSKSLGLICLIFIHSLAGDYS